MEDYIKICKELIEEEVSYMQESDKDLSKKDALEALLEDTGNTFGNIDGSRTCNTYEAQQFIDKSGAIWDTDIHDLFDEMGNDYFFETLKRGAETLDVVILELLSHRVISEMLEEIEATV